MRRPRPRAREPEGLPIPELRSSWPTRTDRVQTLLDRWAPAAVEDQAQRLNEAFRHAERMRVDTDRRPSLRIT
jgi:hypothetical protein